jgi:serine protease AprX
VRKIALFLTRFLLSLACIAAAAPAHAGRIARDLEKQIEADPLSLRWRRVIVQFNSENTDENLLAQLHGGWAFRKLRCVKGAGVVLPQGLIKTLAANVAVKSVSPDRTLHAQWDNGPEASGAAQVWASPGYQGSGVRVAVLDTGVTPSSADWAPSGVSGSRVVAFQDFVNGQTAPYDDNGHGTHVAGIVLGSGNASAGAFRGAAPAAELVAVKVLGQNGSGNASDVIAGIDWCIDNRQVYGIRVLNLSLGHKPEESASTDPLCAAVRRAVQAGIVVVCAAGNHGRDGNGSTRYGGIGNPAIEPSVITVGALNTSGSSARNNDQVCTFSSRGPTYLDHAAKPDLVAPGNRIVSVRAPGSYLDTSFPGNRVTATGASSADYFHLSGTSMAAPHVAGIVGLMLQSNPALQPNTVKALLTYTAQRLTLMGDNGQPLSSGLSQLTQGAGSVNAVAAVQVAGQLNHGAAVGSTWLNGSLAGQSTVAGTTFPWWGGTVWDTQVLSGTNLLAVRQTAWANPVPWSSTTTWSAGVSSADSGVGNDQASWGAQAGWNDPAFWGASGTWGNQFTWGEGPMLAGDAPPITPPVLPPG